MFHDQIIFSKLSPEEQGKVFFAWVLETAFREPNSLEQAAVKLNGRERHILTEHLASPKIEAETAPGDRPLVLLMRGILSALKFRDSIAVARAAESGTSSTTPPSEEGFNRAAALNKKKKLTPETSPK